MPYKFNPFTGTFDYYEKGEAVVSEEAIQFVDNFDDGALFWGWRDLAKLGAITEAGDAITLSLGIVDGRWAEGGKNNAPRIFTGAVGYHCIIETKLNSYTVNDFTQAGLFFSNAPDSNFNTTTYLYGRTRDSGAAIDGLAAHYAGAVEFSNGIITLPIWLRFKLCVINFQGGKVIAEYSTDGTTWIPTGTSTFLQSPVIYGDGAVGLFARNNIGIAGQNTIDAPFEYFRMYRSFGPTV